ncbi:MAG TPA: bifunctional DNA-formamidopyrimidine glycosylase/DNA-(apurinic or apyrimidinic site) lyase [Gemmatimonadaceae bacterium]|jgi:formamidopyrimidine-DNA glycosylase
MPELPEVEAARKQLASAAEGKVISRLRLLHPALAKRITPLRLRKLKGRRIERVERRGKHQLLHLDDGRTLAIHFRMNGDWSIGAVGDDEPRFTRAALELEDGTRVALTDMRALSTVELFDIGEGDPELGPEPSDPAFNADTLGVALARRRGAIKPALLDQRMVAGIGNIYAAEALWLAKISPKAKAASLSAHRRERLIQAIREVLSDAPAGRYWAKHEGSRWNVYDREGEKCPRCGATIRRIVQAGRSTFYCPVDQKS